MQYALKELSTLRVENTTNVKATEVAVSGFGPTSKLSPLKLLHIRSGSEKNIGCV